MAIVTKGDEIEASCCDPKVSSASVKALGHPVSPPQPRSHLHGAADYGRDDGGDTASLKKRLLLKLDLRIVSWLTVLYLFSSLDRGNIGNARMLGIEDSIGLVGNQFYNVVSVFYAGYTISQIPSNLVLKKILPSRWMCITMTIWGICATGTAACHSYGGLIATRFFMGIFEAGVGPGAPLLLSWWYLRDELAWRVSLFFGSSTLAGAFGGLIAYGVGKNLANSHLEPWRILFIIEGSLTIFFGLLTWVVLPDLPTSSPSRRLAWLDRFFLKPEERDLAIRRFNSEHNSDSKSFEMGQLIAAFKDYKTWLCGLLYIGLNICLSSYTSFLPTIIGGFGVSALDTQLLSVPPYAFACVCVFVFSWNSDRTRIRGFHITASATVSALGYTLLLSNHILAVNYVGVCLVACGLYPIIPLTLSWVANNHIGHTKRATALAILNMLGQCFATLGGQIYKSKTAPRFYMGHSICLAFIVLTGITASILSSLLYLENKRRDRLQSTSYVPSDDENMGPELETPKDKLYDKNPSFRYFI
ncbi:hypothetical protein H4219_002301 [Mycoemilia scoparia]|uniref:Major facilitator superfamily (MFS) profile domain-containing protein n=1 Tax=Mycoemilia scoparia TaxID=417184 RepID=A0A9W8DQS5_9FUNG|nr:hypothetical protein H4219_002301 [Mycoemilia scoparia]